MQKSVASVQNITPLKVLKQQSLRHMGSKRPQLPTGQHSSPTVYPEKRGKIKSSRKNEAKAVTEAPAKGKTPEHRIDIGDEHSDLLGYDVFSGKLALIKKSKSTHVDGKTGSLSANPDNVDAKLSSKALVWGTQMIYLEDVISVSYSAGLRHFTIHSYPLRKQSCGLSSIIKAQRRQKDFCFLASTPEEAIQWVSGFAELQCFVKCLPHPMASSKKDASDLVASIPLYDHQHIKCKSPPKVLVILNPRSGHGRSSKVFHGKVEPIFELAGFKMEVVKTESAGHARKLASSVDFTTCPDGIICVGGDGIINEVLNGLLSRDNQKEAVSIPIGIIPAGSDNSLVWTILGVRDPVSAAITIVKGGLTATDVFAVDWIQTGIVHYGTTVSYFGFLSDDMNNFSVEDNIEASTPIQQVQSDFSTSPIELQVNMAEDQGGDIGGTNPGTMPDIVNIDAEVPINLIENTTSIGAVVGTIPQIVAAEGAPIAAEGASDGTGREENERNNGTQKAKRQKTSMVWQEFIEVDLPDGTKKVQCIHCKSKYAMSVSGVTSHLNRHLKTCLRRKVVQQSQQLLSFQPERSGVEAPTFGPQSKYDHDRMKEAIGHWVLMHEHPFTIVEEEGFNFMMKISNPMFEKISRTTLKNDCIKVYEAEKRKLKGLIKSIQKISLTTDMWKSSNQKIEYMVITGHFIDQNWRLQKRVLSFVHIPPPRRGIDVADALYKCLKEWEIEKKVYTISVDNAAYNDVAVRTLRDNFSRGGKLPCGGKLFHVRCCAHILNLLVQDGISQIGNVIENVRESVKFINQTEGRLRIFSEIVHQLQLPFRKLILDCPTRWNSTYDMLSTAMKFKDVFPRFKDRESLYDSLPSEEDWMKVESVCEVLEVFNDVTNIISGSEYPTSNLYLSEVFRIKDTLDKKSLSIDDFMRGMVKKMKDKFDKYWGQCNLVMALASVLDPRCKMKLVEFCFPIIYSENEARMNIAKVKEALYDTYNDYLEMHNALLTESSSNVGGSSVAMRATGNSYGGGKQSGWSMFGQFIRSVETTQPQKSDLDIYLEEGVYMPGEEAMSSFDALEWWKVNNLRYKVLSKMACDILAIPISTVASEATFSAGSRVIETYRASLSPETVEMLICGGDWIRHLHGLKKKKKNDRRTTEIILQNL